ncbi:MAG: RDD family protein [Oscillospiraceae bacterium]|nr:RDD family protein [Oscillospiraceae bacterium]
MNINEKQNRRKSGATKSILRLLSALVDFIIIMVPVQLVLLGIIGVPERQANFLFQMLFAVYGVALISVANGQTVGKLLSRLTVRDKAGPKATFLYIGIRELTKAVYFIPIVGWAMGGVSAILMFLTGRALHDYIADTKVIFLWEVPKDEEGGITRGK